MGSGVSHGGFGDHPEGQVGVGKPTCMGGRNWEVLPECREGQEILPEGREGLGGPPRRPDGVRRSSRRAGRGREALRYGLEK